eukprot:6189822-Pleurochrysis_carterae.AAC.2
MTDGEHEAKLKSDDRVGRAQMSEVPSYVRVSACACAPVRVVRVIPCACLCARVHSVCVCVCLSVRSDALTPEATPRAYVYRCPHPTFERFWEMRSSMLAGTANALRRVRRGG